MTRGPKPWRVTITRHNGARSYQWKHGVDARKYARGTYRQATESDHVKQVLLHKLTDQGWEEVDRYDE